MAHRMNGGPAREQQADVERRLTTDSTVTYHQSRSDTDRRRGEKAAVELDLPGAPPGNIGRYQVLKTLGQGGFGTVYLAHDPVLDRSVALKVNRAEIAPTGPKVEMLFREARLAAKVRHERIVTIYDVGVCDETGVYVAMEYVAGEPLSARLKDGPLEQADAIRITAQIADGIHYAHRQGLVHRDLKPANILIDDSGNIKVADFGLALHVDSQHESKGEVSGTVRYMSPEQFEGNAHLLDGRSDIWSLGVILYECLCGTTPFRAGNLETFRDELLNRSPRPLRQIDDSIDQRVDDICQKCLARSQDDRFPTALDVRQALLALRKRWRTQFKRLAAGVTAVTCLSALIFILAQGSRLERHVPGSPTDSTLTVETEINSNGDGRVDLLKHEPIPFLFDSTAEFSSASYAPDVKRFTVHAEGTSLFASPDHEESSGQVKLTCRLNENRGRVGMFWGLHEDLQAGSEPTHRCLAVLIMLEPEFNKARFYLKEFTVVGASPAERHIPTSRTLASATWELVLTDEPQSRDRVDSIFVTLTKGRPQEINAFGQEIDLSLTDGQVNWTSYQSGQSGIIVGRGDAVVSQFVLQPLE